MLEERLEEVDQKEKCPLFLGVSRSDENSERATLLSEIESQLSDYGEYGCMTLVLALLLNQSEQTDLPKKPTGC